MAATVNATRCGPVKSRDVIRVFNSAVYDPAVARRAGVRVAAVLPWRLAELTGRDARLSAVFRSYCPTWIAGERRQARRDVQVDRRELRAAPRASQPLEETLHRQRSAVLVYEYARIDHDRMAARPAE